MVVSLGSVEPYSALFPGTGGNVIVVASVAIVGGGMVIIAFEIIGKEGTTTVVSTEVTGRGMQVIGSVGTAGGGVVAIVIAPAADDELPSPTFLFSFSAPSAIIGIRITTSSSKNFLSR